MNGAPRPTPLAAGEELEYARAVMRHFHEDVTDEELAPFTRVFADPHAYRGWLVRDDGEIVGNAGAYAFEVEVPGGGRLDCAGVTMVGVAQTHRRRGLLSELMTTLLDDAVRRGEPVAALHASESAIYGRFGFGPAVPMVAHRIERGAAFHTPAAPGLVAPATPRQAAAEWPAILESLAHPGCLVRPPALWQMAVVDDPPSWRDGATPRRLVHVPGRGYAAYRIRSATDGELPAGEVRLEELVAVDAEAAAALWQHVCDLDLTTVVTAPRRPVDDALPPALVDPLRAHTRIAAPVYVRLLDVPAALAARRYACADGVTFTVHDASRDQSGTYRLEAGPDGAEVRRTTAAPELTLPVEVLATVWLGGVRATRLLAARRLEEHVEGAVARLDRLLGTERAPWTPFEF